MLQYGCDSWNTKAKIKFISLALPRTDPENQTARKIVKLSKIFTENHHIPGPQPEIFEPPKTGQATRVPLCLKSPYIPKI